MGGEPVRMAKLTRVEDENASFDREFWRRVGPIGRRAAILQMVQERHGKVMRLDRSVARLRRGEES